MLFASPYDVGNIEVSVLEAHVSFHYCGLVVKKVEPKWQHLYGEEIICKEDGFDLDVKLKKLVHHRKHCLIRY